MTENNNNNNKPKDCKICGKNNSVIFDYNTGELVCTQCGAVLAEDDIETQTTIQATTTNEDVRYARTKQQSAINDGRSVYVDKISESRLNNRYGLSTMIYSNDIYLTNKNTKLSAEQQNNAFRLQKINSKIGRMSRRKRKEGMRSDRQEYTVIKGSNILYDLKSKVNLSNAVTERSVYYFKQTLNRNLVKGRTIQGMAIACLYIATKEMGLPHTVEDLVAPLLLLDITQYQKSKLALIKKYYRVIVKELDIKLNNNNNNAEKNNNNKNEPAPIIKTQYLSKYINQLGLPLKLYHKAVEILNLLTNDPEASGKRPSILEATVLWYVYQQYVKEHPEEFKINKKIITRQFAYQCGTTEVSLRNNLRFLKEKLSLSEEKKKLSV
jgi:transcription initiation factor TFIIB